MQFAFSLSGNRKVMTIYRHLSTDKGKVVAVNTVKACGGGGIAPFILTLALDGGQWSALCLGCFFIGNRAWRPVD